MENKQKTSIFTKCFVTTCNNYKHFPSFPSQNRKITVKQIYIHLIIMSPRGKLERAVDFEAFLM